ncbi:DUF3710 domain-containing protein [Nonomuraea gerenzanensis]|uniref:DUF3710 domain-containing protein n=1 Tax=Nonomuraea gerenzanensis TaxID=93944 RepID=A0A1M4EK90_9ACTN|nr:DUF3710 domain-containing protein [Nonomuraea gerenzanensis]UBU10767.1 DUF3710 domain-containing protein [Nonomuraea gerenzanensis]SBO99196.1 FIG01122115: hypothetical protein [Nonomuraea gerenzanensis]
MFRRRRREQAEQAAEQEAAAPTRESGPWDADEPHPEAERIDLGGLRLPHNPDFDVRLASVGDQHVGVVVLYDESSLQLQALAAPRSSGLWDEVKTKILAQAKHLEERQGPFGSELTGEMKAEGNSRPARYLGIDGPRWFLLAVISGKAAADDTVAQAYIDFIKDVVVVRGDEPMAREEPIPLRRPNEQSGETGEQSQGFNPFKRGPEISEIR